MKIILFLHIYILSMVLNNLTYKYYIDMFIRLGLIDNLIIIFYNLFKINLSYRVHTVIIMQICSVSLQGLRGRVVYYAGFMYTVYSGVG